MVNEGIKRISENEVEVLEIDKLTVQKRKELTTCFAGLFLAHPRDLKGTFSTSRQRCKI